MASPSLDAEVRASRNDSAPTTSPPFASPSSLPTPAGVTNLPLFADSFSPSADFSAIAALLEEEEDEQHIRERAARDEAKLRRRQQRMDVEAEAEAEAESTTAPSSSTRLHRAERRAAAQPYGRAAVTPRGKRRGKSSKPKPIQPQPLPHSLTAMQSPSNPPQALEAEEGGRDRALTAAETALFIQMWHISSGQAGAG